MHKAGKLVAVTGLMGLIVFAVLAGWLPWHRSSIPWTSAGAVWRDAVHVQLKETAERTGRVFASLGELERTAYYPFEEPASPLEFHGATTLSLHQTEERAMVLSYHSQHRGLGVSDSRELTIWAGSPGYLQRQAVACHLTGVQARWKDIETARAVLVGSMYHAREMYRLTGGTEALTPLHRNSVSVPMPAFDLPRTPGQIVAYEEWVRGLEGPEALEDYWGRQVELAVRGVALVCRSAGPDGVFGTVDDVVESREL